MRTTTMIAGKDLVLMTRSFAREDRTKSWLLTLSTLLLLVCVFACTLIVPFILLKLFFSVVAGLLMMRFFVIYHDYQHHTILHRSRPAKVIFTLYGLFMLSPASIWKRSHDYHHNHNSKLFTASIGSYPIMTLEQFKKATKKERAEYLASRSPLFVLFGYYTMFISGMCVRSFRSSPEKHWDSLLALFLHAAASVTLIVFVGWQAWLFTLFIPFFISLMIGAYLFYVQHNFPGVTFRPKKEWSYFDAALNSSSYLKLDPVMQWFSANIGFHHVHHLNAKIPFYRLPETMDKIKELQSPHTITISPSDIAKCFKLKVWDQETGKMLTSEDLKRLNIEF